MCPYFRKSETTGVMPIPEAMAMRFSQSMAGDENGDRKGPIMKAGRWDGVEISSMRSPVHVPGVKCTDEMMMDSLNH